MNTLSLAKNTFHRYGLIAGCSVIINRILEKISSLRAVEFVYLHENSLSTEMCLPHGYESRFLTPDEVMEFATNPVYDLGSDMAERLRGGKDFCFAALYENRLAAYGWYSLEDIEAEHNFGIAMKFPVTSAYMYKGFTHVDFRGQRLHGILMGQALLALRAQGIESLVSSVGWTNFASLASCKKLGYERLGRVWTFRNGKTILSVPKTIHQKGIILGCSVDSHLR